MKVLLIYQETPGIGLKIFLIEDPPVWISDIDECYINYSDMDNDLEEKVNTVYNAICDSTEDCIKPFYAITSVEDDDYPLPCSWSGRQIKDNQIIDGSLKVVQFGFLI